MASRDSKKRQQYSRKWYLANKERILAKNKERYEQNRERILAWQREYRKRPEVQARKKERLLQKEFGITHKEYETMKQQQGNKCRICQRKKFLVVDHCHRTGKVRGLLCHPCNLALGGFQDSIDLLESARLYLEAA